MTCEKQPVGGEEDAEKMVVAFAVLWVLCIVALVGAVVLTLK